MLDERLVAGKGAVAARADDVAFSAWGLALLMGFQSGFGGCDIVTLSTFMHHGVLLVSISMSLCACSHWLLRCGLSMVR